jgi:uncharacterized Ntn-hydrolase superfamily protein
MPSAHFGRPVSTYSIVAVDRQAEQIGVAVQSHWFSVGSVVPWAEAGVGAVATQSFANPEFGPRGLELLKGGRTPVEAVECLTSADEGRELRQLAIISATGETAAFTGSRCVPEAGHQAGKGYCVQANLMASAEVWPAMAEAFEGGKGPLAERLLRALEAAESRGGDLRGRQSAALLVVRAQSSGRVSEDRLTDLRVEDHPEPLAELARLLRLHRAYEHMNRGDHAVEQADASRALREYGRARSLCSESGEMRFWQAVALVNLGRLPEARPLFREVFAEREAWRELARRLIRQGLLALAEQQLEDGDG